MAARLAQAGANGLVMFNRFYQPDFDLERLEVVPNLVLSSGWEMRLPLRWVSILYGRVPVDFAITSGVHTYEDVLKGVMAGANVTMMASELLRHGVGRIGLVVQELERWLEEHEYESVRAGAGQHEPAQRCRAGRLRASELHEGAAVLEVRPHRGADALTAH